MATQVKKVDIKQFIAANNITSIYPKILVNTNGYPYVCFSKADNSTENIYFSKNAAKLVSAGQEITRDFKNQFQLVETLNAQGELRMKFSSSASVDVDDLF